MNAQQAGTGKNGAGRWKVLSLLGMVPAVMVLNNASVSISISAMVADLDTGVAAIQAVISFYALVTAVCMLPAAKLADRLGAKRLFPLGALLYGCGALVVAAARNSAMLLVGMSLVQGAAASLMMPTALALLSAAYPGPTRAKALAVYSAVASVAMALAPLAAGAVTTFLSWRIVYLLEAALVAVLLLRTRILRGVDAPGPNPAARFDPVGALLVMASLSCVIIGMLLAKTYGWFWALRPFSFGPLRMDTLSPTALLLSAGLAFGVALAAWLVWAAKRGRPALVDIGLLKSRTFDTALAAKTLAQIAMSGVLFALPVYLQNLLGYSALETGLNMLPLPVMLFAAALLGVRLAARLGRKTLIAGGAMLVAGGALAMWPVFHAGHVASGLELLPAVSLLGAGMGCIVSPSNTLALSRVPPALANQGSGILTTANNLASSLGTALSGSLLLGGVRGAAARALETDYPARFGGYTREQMSQLLAQAVDKMNAASPTAPALTASQLDRVETTLVAVLNTSMARLALAMALVAAFAAAAAIFGLPRRAKPGAGPV